MTSDFSDEDDQRAQVYLSGTLQVHRREGYQSGIRIEISLNGREKAVYDLSDSHAKYLRDYLNVRYPEDAND